MTSEEIISRIKAREVQLRAEGVAHLAIFGSRSRGDAEIHSDLDVLIDLLPDARFSLLNLSGVGLLVEEVTGLPTQVVLRRSAPKEFEKRIQGDLKRVF